LSSFADLSYAAVMASQAAHGDLVRGAMTLLRTGRAPDAVALLEPHATTGDSTLLGVLGMALVLAGKRDEAILATRRAIAMLAAHGREDAALFINLGAMLSASGSHDEAIALLTRAREIAATSVEAVIGLASALRAAARYADALGVMKPVMSAPGGPPRDPRVLMMAADLLWDVGRTDQAAPLLAAATRLAPREPRLAILAANLHNYLPSTPAESLAAHRRASALIAAGVTALSPERRARIAPLRVGIVSADLREHSCAWFLQPLLANLDPSRAIVFAYHTLDKFDEVSERLASRCAAFRRCHAMPPTQLADLIRADALDILIETDGLSPNHSHAALAHRPAPRVVTWLGYPNTTGSPGVDVRVVDAITDPMESGVDAACSERLVRLDRCFVCYAPPKDAPLVSDLPMRRAGASGPTLGCFNTMFKFTRQALETYAAVLRGVPSATLLFKNRAVGDPGVARDLSLRFREVGIDPARICCEGWKPGRIEHLAAYANVDVALDAMPYCGTTTTCEALLMGIPVVTLRGTTHAGRVGTSLLTAIGAAEWIADSPQRFASIVADICADSETLAKHRASLRERLLRSSLCDGRAFASAFVSALERIAWE